MRSTPSSCRRTATLIGQPPVEPGQTSHVQLRIRRSDTGEMRWLARQGEYLVEQGADPRFSGVIYDITDAKAEEDELRRLSAMLEDRVEERTRERDRIWRLSRDLYIVCDGEGRCISVNPAWENELGLVAGVMEGRPLADFVLAEDRLVCWPPRSSGSPLGESLRQPRPPHPGRIRSGAELQLDLHF
jgi:PAS domain-containing protein